MTRKARQERRCRRGRCLGESLVGFTLCLPLLVMLLLSSVDLWRIVAATTACQNVAAAGTRYIEEQADSEAAMQGTELYGKQYSRTSGYGQMLNVPLSDVSHAALSNGVLWSDGQAHFITVEAKAAVVGESTYTVTTWPDLTLHKGERTVNLTEVEVKASKTVPLASAPMRALFGESVIVSRVSRGQVPQRVVIV